MENHTSQGAEDEGIDVRKLAKAIRFAFAVIVLFLTGLCLRSSLAIEGFGRIFKDMLGNKPLPSLTTSILAAQPALVDLNVLMLMLVLAACFLRNPVRSFYALGILALIGLVELVLLYHGLTGVLFQIIEAMGADSAV
jgi:hypothetical protein